MAEHLRRLKPLVLPKSDTKCDPGPAPSPILLKLSQLRINDEYQRSLSRDSSKMAKKIATEFDWELYHLLVVSPIDEVDDVTGLPLYEVLDGQHTGIGAITNGNIREVWCWPGRANETAQSRAESFTKLNTNRTNITPVELFWSSVTAGNEEALEVIAACRNTGASVVKRPKPYGDMRIGETIVVTPLMDLAKQGGRPYVERILFLAMSVHLAPISQVWILAFKELVFSSKKLLKIEGDADIVNQKIINAVLRIGKHELQSKAEILHAQAGRRDGNAQYWYLANLIKQEIESHDKT